MLSAPLLLLLLAASVARAPARLVTFSNVEPRRTDAGAVINAHDGTTRRYSAGGRFFYHAMSYPACNETGKINGCTDCIYGVSNGISVWSSDDLSSGSWRLEQSVYAGAAGEPAGFPECTYFRSQAVYNAATQQYVLWANIAGCRSGGCSPGPCSYVTATAPAPGGPFTFHGFAQPPNGTLNITANGGDFALFVDDDGAAYAIITHGIAGAGYRQMIIFALSADYLSFTAARTPELPGPHLVEAPAMFRRGDVYYALLGGCTCMGLYGGGVAVLTARAPLGPWTNITDALDPGCAMEKQSTCFQMGPGAICNPVTQAQQNFVMEVPLAGGGVAHVWTGDRWQQSPDGTYAEQPQTWLPLLFDDAGGIMPLAWVDNFTLDVLVA
jgi:hypothetical protein